MYEPIIKISKHKLDLQKALDAVQDNAHGAVDIFIGTVRDNNNGKKVSEMTYDVHVHLAKKIIREICFEAQKDWSDTRTYVAHRKGKLKVGETSIVIAVSSPHRSESFAACRYVIENIKKRAPVWKKENYEDNTTQWLTGQKLQQIYKENKMC